MTLIALPDGYGAALLGIDAQLAAVEPAAAIRAVRCEADVLRPDLLAVELPPAALAAACGALPDDPGEWGDWEHGDVLGARDVQRLVAVIDALSASVDLLAALPGPSTLAKALAGRPTGPNAGEEDDWDDLVDAAAYAVLDVANACTGARPVGILLREDTAGLEPAGAVQALSSLRRALRHQSRRLMLRLDQSEDVAEGWVAALGEGPPVDAVLVSSGSDGRSPPGTIPLLRSNDVVVVGSASAVIALVVDASSDPEQVQTAVRLLRERAVTA